MLIKGEFNRFMTAPVNHPEALGKQPERLPYPLYLFVHGLGPEYSYDGDK
jgi:hypothetical protein